METKMREKKRLLKLFVMIGLSTLLISCGSSGEEEGTTTSNVAGAAINPVTSVGGSTSCATANSKSELRNVVAQNLFPAENGSAEQYVFLECRNKSNSFLGIDWNSVNCYGSFSRVSVAGQESISHEMGSTKSSLISALLAMIDAADYHDYQYYSSTLHGIKDTNGDTHVLNLCLPLVANPVWFNSDSESYQIYNRYPYYGY